MGRISSSWPLSNFSLVVVALLFYIMSYPGIMADRKIGIQGANDHDKARDALSEVEK